MSIIGELSSTNQIAMAVAAALEQALDGDLVLAVGRPRTAAPSADLLPDAPTRTVTAAILSGASGGLHLVLATELADRLVATTADHELVTALTPVLGRATSAMA